MGKEVLPNENEAHNPWGFKRRGPSGVLPALPKDGEAPEQQRHFQTPQVQEAKAAQLLGRSCQELSHHWKPPQDTATTVNNVNPFQDLN